MAKIKTEPKTKLDQIRDVSPRYADLVEKNNELHARAEELIAEIKPLSEEQRRSQVSFVSQAPKPKPKPVVRHAGATALLAGLLPEQPPEEINPPPPRPSWPGEQRLRELGEESEATQEAIKLLQPELSKARKEYSKAVATKRCAEHSFIVEHVVEAAMVLGDAILEHYKFLDGQRLEGVAYSNFQPLNLEFFGDLGEDFSPLLKLILDAVEKKHVGAGKIPDWKMPAPIQYFSGGN